MAAPKRASGARGAGGARSAATAKGAAPRAGGPAACEAWLARVADSPGTTYLSGSDEALKAEILAALKDAWNATVPDAPPQVFRASEAGPANILAAAQGGSLFQARSLVLVLGAEEWARSASVPIALARALPAIPPENVLVFVEAAGESERKHLNPLRAACARVFALDTLPPSEIRPWAERHARRQGVTLAPDAWDALLELPRLDAGEAFNEVDKLAAWAGDGGTVDRETVLALVHPAGGATLSDLADAVCARDGALAMDRLLRALEGGESSGSILFQLTSLLSGALRLAGGGGGWVRDRRRSARIAESWSKTEIARGMDLLYRCERAWKTGRAPDETLLVRAVQGLTERAPVRASR